MDCYTIPFLVLFAKSYQLKHNVSICDRTMHHTASIIQISELESTPLAQSLAILSQDDGVHFSFSKISLVFSVSVSLSGWDEKRAISSPRLTRVKNIGGRDDASVLVVSDKSGPDCSAWHESGGIFTITDNPTVSQRGWQKRFVSRRNDERIPSSKSTAAEA